MKTALPEASLTPVAYVAQNRGETPLIGHKQLPARGTGAAITSKCKNVEIAVRYLDYGFSEKGHMTYNFGCEGVSYEMKDGQTYLHGSHYRYNEKWRTVHQPGDEQIYPRLL